MKFKYVGPHDAVDLVGHGTVERGKTVDVSGADAASLSKQADWQKVAPLKPPSKKAAAKKDEPPAEPPKGD